MTIKEKLRMMAEVKKANEQRITAWTKERKDEHGKGHHDGRKLQG